MLLQKCMWVSTANGETCTYSTQVSVAQNIDTFQRELSEAADRELTFCAVNTSAVSDLDAYVPWYHSLWTPSATRFQSLLGIIFDDRWPGFHQIIVDFTMWHQQQQPPQPTWDLQLPSQTKSTASHGEASLRNLKISLEWLTKPSQLDTILGSYDWAIYVSEPYTRRPELDVLQISDATVDGSTHRRMAFVSTSGDILARLKIEHDKAVQAGTINPNADVEEQMIGAVLVSLKAIVSDVTGYNKESFEVVQVLVSCNVKATPSR